MLRKFIECVVFYGISFLASFGLTYFVIQAANVLGVLCA